jgi:hypothetical protein
VLAPAFLLVDYQLGPLLERSRRWNSSNRTDRLLLTAESNDPGASAPGSLTSSGSLWVFGGRQRHWGRDRRRRRCWSICRRQRSRSGQSDISSASKRERTSNLPFHADLRRLDGRARSEHLPGRGVPRTQLAIQVFLRLTSRCSLAVLQASSAPWCVGSAANRQGRRQGSTVIRREYQTFGRVDPDAASARSRKFRLPSRSASAPRQIGFVPLP